MKKFVENIVKENEFNPHFYSIFFNPFYLYRKSLARAVRKYAEIFIGKVLDVGCGTKPYSKYFISANKYIGLEKKSDNFVIDKCEVEFFYDGGRFPFKDDEFNGFVCFEMLQYIEDVPFFLSEVRRVTNEGGYCLISMPFIWEDYKNVDYSRLTLQGMKYIVEKNGFEVVSQAKIGGFSEVISQLLILYFINKIRNNKFIRRVCCLFLFSGISLIGLMLANRSLCNDNVYLASLTLMRVKKTTE